MTPRERFWKTMRFEPGAGLPFWVDWIGPWKRWKAEGLPVHLGLTDEVLRAWSIKHFGFDAMYSIFRGQPRVPVELGVCEPPPTRSGGE